MLKRYTVCKKEKELGYFYKKKDSKDGLRSRCKECTKASNSDYYLKNSDKVRSRVSEYREKHLDQIREYDRLRSKKRSPELNRYYLSKKRAKLKKATPNWLKKEHYLKIKTIYKECVERGVDYNVDHIIPLNGKTVSGLHVPWNLQIIKNSDNFKKSNKFDGTYDNQTWKEEIK
jgi:hypothetical protein